MTMGRKVGFGSVSRRVRHDRSNESDDYVAMMSVWAMTVAEHPCSHLRI